jgi:hypothetical protein
VVVGGGGWGRREGKNELHLELSYLYRGGAHEAKMSKKGGEGVTLNKRKLIRHFPIYITSVAEPHHFYAAPAPAPAPTLLYSRSNIFKGVKGNIRSDILFSSDSL